MTNCFFNGPDQGTKLPDQGNQRPSRSSHPGNPGADSAINECCLEHTCADLHTKYKIKTFLDTRGLKPENKRFSEFPHTLTCLHSCMQRPIVHDDSGTIHSSTLRRHKLLQQVQGTGQVPLPSLMHSFVGWSSIRELHPPANCFHSHSLPQMSLG